MPGRTMLFRVMLASTLLAGDHCASVSQMAKTLAGVIAAFLRIARPARALPGAHRPASRRVHTIWMMP